MKPKLFLALLISITLPHAALAQSPPYRCAGSQNVANCPPCYYNFVPVTSGTRGDGRHQVNVFIENPAYGDHLWNAVELGRDMWNEATDTTSSPNTTKRPPVYFEGNQNRNEANVIIRYDESVTLAEADTSVSPPVIKIDPFYAKQLTLQELAAVIAHEIAHPFGLGNAYIKGSGCEYATTIMRGVTADRGKPAVMEVQDRDVFQMNKFWNNRDDCCANADADTKRVEEDECVDNDGDGVSACEGDCNDYDPYLTFDCGGGGGYTTSEYYYEPHYYDYQCYERYMVTTEYDCSGSRCVVVSERWDYMGTYCYYYY